VILGFDLPLGLQGRDDLLVFPAHFMCQSVQITVLERQGKKLSLNKGNNSHSINKVKIMHCNARKTTFSPQNS
jgi:hypothetical protein